MSDKLFKRIAIGLITAWLSLLALLPFVLVFVSSFLTTGERAIFAWKLTLVHYQHLVSAMYLHIFFRSCIIALAITALCLLLGYPFAYIVARAPKKLRMILLFFIIVPFWTSSLIRSYAIITIIKSEGLLNHVLLVLGFIHHPLQILYTPLATQIGLVYSLFPFMVLPIYVVLEKFDWRLVDAARDLGASAQKAFWRIVVPMSFPGILSGCLLVFLPAMTLFYIPDMLGGAKSMLLGNLIYNEFLEVRNWPMGSAMSVVLTLALLLLLFVYVKLTRRKQRRTLL